MHLLIPTMHSSFPGRTDHLLPATPARSFLWQGALQWLFVLAVCLFAGPARGDIVLTVDITDPSAVVFTATGAKSSADSSGVGYGLRMPRSR